MAHISSHDRSQVLLLPASVDDYVDANNPVRIIDAFVASMDREAAGFCQTARQEQADQDTTRQIY
jgi:transposase